MPRAEQLSAGAVKLLQEKHLAMIATLMPDGSPQATPVWIDVEPDGSHLLVNTVAGHLKTRNVARDPRIAVTVIDAENPFRSVVVRGRVVEQRGPEEGADEHLRVMSRKYTGSDVYAWGREGDRRVILRIRPTHVFERGTG